MGSEMCIRDRRQLLATEIVIALPSLNETQTALRVLRNGKEKK